MASSFYSKTKSITDHAEPFISEDLFFYDLNIHIKTHTVKYGDGTVMVATAIAGSTLDFRNGNLKDLFFENDAGGSVAVVTVAGTVISKKVGEALRGV